MPITTTAPAKLTTNQSTGDQENVSATLTVAGPAARVFAVLADPTTHAAIDGTGWVQEAADRAPLGPSETEVTLTYDWSAVPQFIRERGIQFPPFSPEHLTNSLLPPGRARRTNVPGLNTWRLDT